MNPIYIKLTLLKEISPSYNQICNSLSWLGLNWDDELVFQSLRTERYKDIIHSLIKQDKAYYCFSSKDELEELRKKTGNHRYPGIWRERSMKEVKIELSKGSPKSIFLCISSERTLISLKVILKPWPASG